MSSVSSAQTTGAASNATTNPMKKMMIRAMPDLHDTNDCDGRWRAARSLPCGHFVRVGSSVPGGTGCGNPAAGEESRLGCAPLDWEVPAYIPVSLWRDQHFHAKKCESPAAKRRSPIPAMLGRVAYPSR